MSWQAKFIPMMWVNDHTMRVDALAEDTWEISDSAASGALDAARRGSDWDHLRDDSSAPDWVREWPGPFDVELITSGGEQVSAYDVETGWSPA